MTDLHAELREWHREAAKQHPVTIVWPARNAGGQTFPEERRDVTLPKARIMVAHRVLGLMSPAERAQVLEAFEASDHADAETVDRAELAELWVLKALMSSKALEHVGEGEYALERVKDNVATPAKLQAAKVAFLAELAESLKPKAARETKEDEVSS